MAAISRAIQNVHIVGLVSSNPPDVGNDQFSGLGRASLIAKSDASIAAGCATVAIKIDLFSAGITHKHNVLQCGLVAI